MRYVALMACVVVMSAASLSAGQKATGPDAAAIAKVAAAYQAAAGAQDGAALAAFHKAFAQQWMMHGMTITSTETTVTGDTAYDIGTYKQTLMPNKGGPVVEDKGKYVVLLKKNGGAWLITHAIYNSDNPLPAPPAAKK
jgi:ketosteroid isomerase-like protein